MVINNSWSTDCSSKYNFDVFLLSFFWWVFYFVAVFSVVELRRVLNKSLLFFVCLSLELLFSLEMFNLIAKDFNPTFSLTLILIIDYGIKKSVNLPAMIPMLM